MKEKSSSAKPVPRMIVDRTRTASPTESRLAFRAYSGSAADGALVPHNAQAALPPMGVRVLAETIGENPLVAGVVVGDAQAAKRAQEAKRMARKKNRHRIARANAEARHAIALAQAYLAERE